MTSHNVWAHDMTIQRDLLLFIALGCHFDAPLQAFLCPSNIDVPELTFCPHSADCNRTSMTHTSHDYHHDNRLEWGGVGGVRGPA